MALGNVGTALVIVGAAAAVGGVVLWLVAPADDGGVAFGITPFGVQVQGSF